MVKHHEHFYVYPGSYAANKIYEAEFNEILLHIMTNGWDKQAFLQGLYYEAVPFKRIRQYVRAYEYLRIYL